MTITPGLVREHYDRLSALYRAFWGEHIHHGLWDGSDENGRERSPAEAQVALIEELARRAAIPAGARILDVGSGLGGSAFWLARHRNATVRGVTLSPVQAASASRAAAKAGLAGRVTFEVQDADRLDVDPGTFDVVWVIECSEHLEDKARFIRAAADALRPGGVLAVCAWLRAEDLSKPGALELVRGVCRGMLCPSLGSAAEYREWMRAAGLEVVAEDDLTRRVERTWDICGGLLRRLRIDTIVGLVDSHARHFIESFELIRRAYAEDAMSYGLFAARKPESEPRQGDVP